MQKYDEESRIIEEECELLSAGWSCLFHNLNGPVYSVITKQNIQPSVQTFWAVGWTADSNRAEPLWKNSTLLLVPVMEFMQHLEISQSETLPII